MIRSIILVLSFASFFAHAASPEKEIQQLREESNRLSERISRLEATLKSKQLDSVSYAKPDAWHYMNNWGQIKQGMSHEQVESILGKPTKRSVNSINYVKMYYQGNVQGSGYVSGYIELDSDDRVTYSGINPPVM